MRVRLPDVPKNAEGFTSYAEELNRTLEQTIDIIVSSTESRINVQSMSLETTDVSGNLGKNSVILVDSSAGNVAITLPPPVDEYRSVYIVKKISTDANNVTIAARDSGDVEGVAIYTLPAGNYPSIHVISDGYNYGLS